MVWLLVACEAASSGGVPNPAHQPLASRWIHQTWFGPAIINNGPSVTLCPNGTYQMTAPFKAPPHASGMSVSSGYACCRESEHGRYELARDPRSQDLASVHFMPEGGKPYDDPVTNGMIKGFALAPHAFECIYR